MRFGFEKSEELKIEPTAEEAEVVGASTDSQPSPGRLAAFMDGAASEAGAESAEGLFALRMKNSDSGFLFQNQEGKWYPSKQVWELFNTYAQTLRYPKNVVQKLFDEFVKPYNSAVAEKLRSEENDGVDELLKNRDVLVRDLFTNPGKYGIDLADFEKPVSQLFLTPEALIERLQDIEVTEDAETGQKLCSVEATEIFEKSRRRLTVNNIRSACDTLINQVFESENTSARAVFKQKTLQTLIDVLKDNVFNRSDSDAEKAEKKKIFEATLTNLALFMQDIIVAGNREAYDELILEGIDSQGAALVDFPALRLRMPYKIESQKSKLQKPQYNALVRSEYRSRISQYAPEAIDVLRAGYQQGSDEVLYDEAGRKELIHITEEINALLTQAGFTQEHIDDFYAGELGAYITNRVQAYRPLREANRKKRDLEAKHSLRKEEEVELKTVKLEIKAKESVLRKADSVLVRAVGYATQNSAEVQFKYLNKRLGMQALTYESD